jgi:hypothetical protein
MCGVLAVSENTVPRSIAELSEFPQPEFLQA